MTTSPRLAELHALPPGVVSEAWPKKDDPDIALRLDGEPVYRRRLRWHLKDEPETAPYGFIGLNPSSANEQGSDNTIRRDWGFVRAWGGTVLEKANLFDVRATDAADLACWRHSDDYPEVVAAWALDIHRAGGKVIACWGGPYSPKELQLKIGARAVLVMARVALAGVPLYTLAKSRDGYPRHTLYLKGDLQPVLWRAA